MKIGVTEEIEIDQKTFSKVAEPVYNGSKLIFFYNFDFIFALNLNIIMYFKTEVTEENEIDIQKIDQKTFSKVAETVDNVIPG